jgi:cysteine-rich repeat protein
MRKTITSAAIAAMMLTGASAIAASSPADKCEASKHKTVGAYYSCREKAEATAITKAAMPDYSKCTAKFDDKWDGAETAGAGMCPDAVLTAPMNAFIAAQAAEAALVVAGAPIPDCAGDLSTCEGDLTTCDGDLAACEAVPVCGDGLVAGGEECDDGNLSGATCATQGFAGGTLACSFCMFDESACYATRFDASGATIIDHQTGLEWEKKDSAGEASSGCPGGPTCANAHDVDNYYVWSSSSTAPDGGRSRTSLPSSMAALPRAAQRPGATRGTATGGFPRSRSCKAFHGPLSPNSNLTRRRTTGPCLPPRTPRGTRGTSTRTSGTRPASTRRPATSSVPFAPARDSVIRSFVI